MKQFIIALRSGGTSIRDTVKLVGCSVSLVKTVWKAHKAANVAAALIEEQDTHTD